MILSVDNRTPAKQMPALVIQVGLFVDNWTSARQTVALPCCILYIFFRGLANLHHYGWTYQENRCNSAVDPWHTHWERLISGQKLPFPHLGTCNDRYNEMWKIASGRFDGSHVRGVWESGESRIFKYFRVWCSTVVEYKRVKLAFPDPYWRV